MSNEKQTEKAEFGYSASNPILAASIPHSAHYMSRLRYPDAIKIDYRRLGVAKEKDKDGNLLDIYIVDVTMNDGTERNYSLYMNPYAGTTSTAAPKGFELSNDVPALSREAKQAGKAWSKMMRYIKKRIK